MGGALTQHKLSMLLAAGVLGRRARAGDLATIEAAAREHHKLSRPRPNNRTQWRLIFARSWARSHGPMVITVITIAIMLHES